MNPTRELLTELHNDYQKADNARFVADLKTRNVLLACANTGLPPSSLQLSELRELYAKAVNAGCSEYITPEKITRTILNKR